MEFKKLKDFDPSLEIHVENNFSGDIISITNVHVLKDNHIIFIKDVKFLNSLVDHLKKSEAKNLCLITERKMLHILEESEISKYMDRFSLVAVVDNVPLAICKLSKPFYDEMRLGFDDENDGRATGNIDPSAKIAPNVFIGKNVTIGKNAVITSGCNILSNAKIGDNTELYPNVTIYQNVEIGKNCRIHSSTIIGADGFGYTFDQGVHHKIWHIGGVVIGDDVEIGATTTVDAGTFTPTIIKSGTKLDNGVQVGHNSHLGQGVILCGHTAVAGSCTLGNYVVFGGKSGIAPDISLGDGCQVAGGSLVSKSWPGGTKLAGHPARTLRDWLRGNAYVQKALKEKK